MIDIKKYCEYLYNTLYIPMYLYSNKELINCYGNQKMNIIPPCKYLKTFWQANKDVNYIITQFHSYYGYIKIKNSKYSIVIGPVNSLPYSKDILFSIQKDFSVKESETEKFNSFFNNIPTQDLHKFINTLLLINYTVNNTELTMKDVQNNSNFSESNSIKYKFTEYIYIAKENEIEATDYLTESEMFQYVESGNIIGLKNFLNQPKNLKFGKVAHDNLRQWKNILIITISLAARAAIKGGFTPSIAYKLSDIYIQKVEELTNLEDIYALFPQVLYDYTNRVENLIIPLNADTILRNVSKYVHENTNKNIKVADIAENIGFNRSYLSRKVKEELGFDLSTFIRKCKLDEAKALLAYTDKSIGDISNFLCFSSQSHFQKAFKNEYGITPHLFRKSAK